MTSSSFSSGILLSAKFTGHMGISRGDPTWYHLELHAHRPQGGLLLLADRGAGVGHQAGPSALQHLHDDIAGYCTILHNEIAVILSRQQNENIAHTLSLSSNFHL
jgi:hypothetical protein